MPAGWVLPADPCAICVTLPGADASALPHTCALTLTRAAVALTDPDGDTCAYPVAFARALRDA